MTHLPSPAGTDIVMIVDTSAQQSEALLSIRFSLHFSQRRPIAAAHARALALVGNTQLL